MKQNSRMSYVKRNNKSEGLDSNEQCSSNVKKACTKSEADQM